MQRSAPDILFADLAAAHLGPSRLSLRRAWARSEDHLSIEYEAAGGRIIPGQWLRDETAASEMAAQLREAAPLTQGVGAAQATDTRVLLQPEGADLRLVGLGSLVSRTDATLISHRPDRRAVVRIAGPNAPRYVKVIRPSRGPRARRAIEFVASMADRRFITAEVAEIDEPRGRITTIELVATALHDLATDPARFLAGALAAGSAVRSLHRQPTSWLPPHDAGAETALLEARLRCAAVFSPAVHAALTPHVGAVLDSLRTSSPRVCVIHRDLHDKQVFVARDGRVGLIDLDTLAAGEPALDAANMLVHLELLSLRGRCGARVAADAADAFLEGYGLDPRDAPRVQAYGDAARLRLAMLLALWPAWAVCVPSIIERIGAPMLRLPRRRGRSRPRALAAPGERRNQAAQPVTAPRTTPRQEIHRED